MNFIQKISNLLKKIVGPIIGLIAIISSVVTILQYYQIKAPNVFDPLIRISKNIATFFGLSSTPLIVWLVVLAFLTYLYFLSKRLSLVAGEFKDNFKHGLVNWEYGNESWSIVKGEQGYELDITNSNDGGITNIGFTWSSVEFSFECKLFDKAVGWLVRATNREHYIMIQLNNNDQDKLLIRPHYRFPNSWQILEFELKCSEQLKNKIKSCRWFNVKLVVMGNTIDVFIDKEHVLNHHIPDTLKIQEALKFTSESIEGRSSQGSELQLTSSFSYPSGKVGFRCHGHEHAHIRNVTVKPLFWNKSKL